MARGADDARPASMANSVGGVRFRAWKPAASLHPTIDVDAPLVFDVYDRWTRRRSPVAPIMSRIPEGAILRHFPVNGNEAESRRLSRFFAIGHTAGHAAEPRDILRRNSRTRWICAGADVIDAADDRGVDPMVAGYRPPAGRSDEMLEPDGTLRPHWRTFIDGLTAMGGEGRMHAAETAARMLHENDVTYIAQGTEGESARDWRLDMLPLILAPAEWHALEVGLTQRARLLNMIVADLYGPQQLLKSRSLPPALVFGNPGIPAAVSWCRRARRHLSTPVGV